MPASPVGFLNILKAPGDTSHTVVARVRRIIGERRVGHAGTLDPAAVGVLPIAVGQATRFTMAAGWHRKTYWADVRFGASTTTDDAEGAVLETGDPSVVTLPRVLEALSSFRGVIRQEPPIYSALHVDGERSYRRARQGVATPLKPREVQVDDIRVLGWKPPLLSLDIECRSGTYIRSLARDLGRRLGCPAHLDALVRLRVGQFAITDAVRLEDLEAAVKTGDWRELLWPADVAVGDLDTLVVDQAGEADFVHGRRWGRVVGTSRVRVYSQSGSFLGLAEPDDDCWKPAVVLESAS